MLTQNRTPIPSMVKSRNATEGEYLGNSGKSNNRYRYKKVAPSAVRVSAARFFPRLSFGRFWPGCGFGESGVMSAGFVLFLARI